jgi:hypothetical protein
MRQYVPDSKPAKADENQELDESIK